MERTAGRTKEDLWLAVVGAVLTAGLVLVRAYSKDIIEFIKAQALLAQFSKCW